MKYQQLLTHTLSLDEIRHRQLPSFCIHNRIHKFSHFLLNFELSKKYKEIFFVKKQSSIWCFKTFGKV